MMVGLHAEVSHMIFFSATSSPSAPDHGVILCVGPSQVVSQGGRVSLSAQGGAIMVPSYCPWRVCGQWGAATLAQGSASASLILPWNVPRNFGNRSFDSPIQPPPIFL